MPLTSDERSRFLASLRDDLEFRQEVRREVLTTELISLPERFAAFVEEMHAFVEEMHAFRDEVHTLIETINRRLDAVDRDLSRLKDDSGKLRGMVLELKVWNNPGYYLRNHARRVKNVSLDELLDFVGIPDMSDAEYVSLASSDILARGVSVPDGAPVLLVVEATWRVHRDDVERQVVRREILRNRGIPAMAIVLSVEPPNEDIEHYAELNGIFVEAHELKGDAA